MLPEQYFFVREWLENLLRCIDHRRDYVMLAKANDTHDMAEHDLARLNVQDGVLRQLLLGLHREFAVSGGTEKEAQEVERYLAHYRPGDLVEMRSTTADVGD